MMTKCASMRSYPRTPRSQGNPKIPRTPRRSWIISSFHPPPAPPAHPGHGEPTRCCSLGILKEAREDVRPKGFETSTFVQLLCSCFSCAPFQPSNPMVALASELLVPLFFPQRLACIHMWENQAEFPVYVAGCSDSN